MPKKRRTREPGTPPRSIVLLAALALAGGTAVALWLLPAQTAPEPAASAAGPVVAPAGAATTAATTVPVAQGAVPEGPSGFLVFVDTARVPGFDLAQNFGRTGVRWYTLGHVVGGGAGCAPKWGGKVDLGGNPVANGLGRLRAEGADAGPSFGGAAGPELADSCAPTTALAAAYRKVIAAFDAAYVDFEIRDGADAGAVLRRARALRALQDERPLHVTFTLPLGPGGLSERDAAMLRLTHQTGAQVAAVNLLVAIEPHTAQEGRMRRVAEALRAAQLQIAEAQELADPAAAWRRIAVTSVLVSADDLDETDARKLTSFAARHELAWLSTRGAAPSPAVARILWRTRA